MNWIKNLQRVTHLPKVIGSIPTSRSSSHSLVNKQQYDVLLADKFLLCKRVGLAKGDIALAESLVSKRKSHWRSYGANLCRSNNNSVNLSRKFVHAIHNGPNLSRDFLVQLWVADDKLKRSREKRKQKSVEHASKHETVFGTKAQHGSFFSGSSVTGDGHYDYRQVATEPIEFASPEEAWIAPLLSRSNLLITRDIEWANLTLGFEQENRYAVVDVNEPQVPAGFIREESNVIYRQILRTRRPFVASITDGYGNELFRVRRPFWWITSSIYAEVGGKEIGVVHRRWHLWRRIYDLYLGNEQFAVVENPGFWYWTFTLKGINGEVLAEIDRDWRGFGFEVLTDAGQYVIRFGSAAVNGTMPHLSGKVREFEVARPLTLAERAVTVALAVSLDNDYFSRHGGCLTHQGTMPESVVKMVLIRIAASVYEAMGLQRWLPARSQLESMSKSRHDHVEGGYTRSQEPLAIDQNYISWLREHPSALSSFNRMINVAKGKQIIVFLDYDGTLSPIVSDPERAFMSDQMRAAVRDVSNCFPTAIISGRSREKVYDFVKLNRVYYSGSHGMDTAGPARKNNSYDKNYQQRSFDREGNELIVFQPAQDFLPALKKLLIEVTKRTQNIKGVVIEDNRFCLSVHYRHVKDEDYKRLEDEVQLMIANNPDFHMTTGNKVFEIRPSIEWNKGDALKYLLESLGFHKSSDVFPIYIGDDRTDEDAFKVLRERGEGYPIIVSSTPRETMALHSLRNPSEVQSFLTRLSRWGFENSIVDHQ